MTGRLRRRWAEALRDPWFLAALACYVVSLATEEGSA